MKLVLQKAYRVDEGGPAHGVRTDEFAKSVERLRRRALLAFALDKVHAEPPRGQLVGRFAARKTCPNNRDDDVGFHVQRRITRRAF